MNPVPQDFIKPQIIISQPFNNLLSAISIPKQILFILVLSYIYICQIDVLAVNYLLVHILINKS